MTAGQGSPDAVIAEDRIPAIIEAGTPISLYDNKRVLVLTPDATRTCPLPMMIRAIREVIGGALCQTGFHGGPGNPHPAS